MSETNNVTGTAFIIAAFRVEENGADSPLYTDRIAELFLDDKTREMAESIAQNFPQAKEMVKLRTKYFDDVLSNQISNGYRQIIILGSGLDTRAVRHNIEGTSYFEIDNEATLRLKEDTLNKNNIDTNICYISADYVKNDWVSLLKKTHFNFELPAYFLWEGNTTLLTEEEVIFVLKQIRAHIKIFRISFDYMSDKIISRTTGYQDINDYIDRYESMYAPWVTGFENIEPLAQSLGLRVIENFSTADLHRKYRPNHPLESNIFKFYFVCTLGNK